MEEDKKIQETEYEEIAVDQQPQEKQALSEKDKKIKNLIALSILLGGLFVGSLFVDVVQLVKGGGFSQRALQKTDVFALNGKTWVAYSDPVVKVQVINDDNCVNCKPDEVLIGLRRIMPTMLTEKVDVNSEQGKKLIETYSIKSIPAYIFSKEVESTDLYAQAQALFEKKDDQYVLKTQELGVPAGKIVGTPDIRDNDVKLGANDSKVKLVEFSDFQCPYCKKNREEVTKKVLSEYGDQVQYVFKQVPVDANPQSINAVLAAACANDQEKYIEYSDKLFENQTVWPKAKGNDIFKSYAKQVGLNVSEFNKCLDDKKYESLVKSDIEDAQKMGIEGTPSIFVNDQFQEGNVTFDSVKSAIENQLAK